MSTKRQEELGEAVRDYLFTRVPKASEIGLGVACMAPAMRGEQCPRVNPLVTRFGVEFVSSQTYVLDLRLGREVLWRRMEHRGRKDVRAAEKNGLTVRTLDRTGDLDQYHALQSETLLRNGQDTFPRAFWEHVWRTLHAEGLVFALLAESNGIPVACANFAVYKGAAYYWTMGASDAGLSLKANNLVQWRAIELLIARRIEWYDVGTADFAFGLSGSPKARRISMFKRAMGGDLYPRYLGRFYPGDRLYLGLRTIQRFMQIMRR